MKKLILFILFTLLFASCSSNDNLGKNTTKAPTTLKIAENENSSVDNSLPKIEEKKPEEKVDYSYLYTPKQVFLDQEKNPNSHYFQGYEKLVDFLNANNTNYKILKDDELYPDGYIVVDNKSQQKLFKFHNFHSNELIDGKLLVIEMNNDKLTKEESECFNGEKKEYCNIKNIKPKSGLYFVDINFKDPFKKNDCNLYTNSSNENCGLYLANGIFAKYNGSDKLTITNQYDGNVISEINQGMSLNTPNYYKIGDKSYVGVGDIMLNLSNNKVIFSDSNNKTIRKYDTFFATYKGQKCGFHNSIKTYYDENFNLLPGEYSEEDNDAEYSVNNKETFFPNSKLTGISKYSNCEFDNSKNKLYNLNGETKILDFDVISYGISKNGYVIGKKMDTGDNTLFRIYDKKFNIIKEYIGKSLTPVNPYSSFLILEDNNGEKDLISSLNGQFLFKDITQFITSIQNPNPNIGVNEYDFRKEYLLIEEKGKFKITDEAGKIILEKDGLEGIQEILN